MTPTAIFLAVLLHGRAAEAPVPLLAFASGRACASAMQPVETGLRFDWPAAVVICRRSGAPLTSFAPPQAPWAEVAQ